MFGQCTVVLAIMLALSAEVTTADSSSTAYFPANLYLVRATTVDVTTVVDKKAQPPSYLLGSFVITHVYAGGGSLKGKKFVKAKD